MNMLPAARTRGRCERWRGDGGGERGFGSLYHRHVHDGERMLGEVRRDVRAEARRRRIHRAGKVVVEHHHERGTTKGDARLVVYLADEVYWWRLRWWW